VSLKSVSNWPTKKYQVVLMDPPWSYYGLQNKMGAAANHYLTMTDDELMALPVADLLHKDSVVFMWVTSPRLDFAIDLLRSWGLFYRGIAFNWVKTKKDGFPMGAKGVRPSIVKPTSELVIVASFVEKGRPLKLFDETIRQVVMAQVQEHSRKPDEIHDSIDKMYPDAKKLEMFARRPRQGWDVWGNEV